MAEENTQLAISPSANLPSYINPETDDLGMQNLEQYVTPPLVAIIQGMTRPPAKDLGPEGTVYTKPGYAVIWRPAFPAANKPADDIPIMFVPLFMFTEFICWNPSEIAGLPIIRERTTDQNSDLAKISRKFKKEERQILCPESPLDEKGNPKYWCRAQEHINFIIMFQSENPDLNGMQVLLSFSSTSLKEGRDLCTAIKSRGQLPIYAQIYTMSSKSKSNAKGIWKGWNIFPALEPNSTRCKVVDEEWYHFTKGRYEELRDKYNAGLIQAAYDEEEATTGETATAPATTVAM